MMITIERRQQYRTAIEALGSFEASAPILDGKIRLALRGVQHLCGADWLPGWGPFAARFSGLLSLTESDRVIWNQWADALPEWEPYALNSHHFASHGYFGEAGFVTANLGR